jgi:hypothetical protein
MVQGMLIHKQLYMREMVAYFLAGALCVLQAAVRQVTAA